MRLSSALQDSPVIRRINHKSLARFASPLRQPLTPCTAGGACCTSCAAGEGAPAAAAGSGLGGLAARLRACSLCSMASADCAATWAAARPTAASTMPENCRAYSEGGSGLDRATLRVVCNQSCQGCKSKLDLLLIACLRIGGSHNGIQPGHGSGNYNLRTSPCWELLDGVPSHLQGGSAPASCVHMWVEAGDVPLHAKVGVPPGSDLHRGLDGIRGSTRRCSHSLRCEVLHRLTTTALPCWHPAARARHVAGVLVMVAARTTANALLLLC